MWGTVEGGVEKCVGVQGKCGDRYREVCRDVGECMG